MYGDYLKPRKTCFKRLKRTISGAHTGLGLISVARRLGKKSHNSQGNKQSAYKVYVSVKERKCLPLRCVQLFVTPWTVARQAPLSMGFSRQEYWSRLPFPPPRDLLHPGIEPQSPTLQADSLPTEPPEKTYVSVVGKN